MHKWDAPGVDLKAHPWLGVGWVKYSDRLKLDWRKKPNTLEGYGDKKNLSIIVGWVRRMGDQSVVTHLPRICNKYTHCATNIQENQANTYQTKNKRAKNWIIS